MADREYTNPIELDFAWAAGFLDGEGCFALSKASKNSHASTKRPVVIACQSSIEPLEKLKSLFGESIGKQRVTDKGTQMYQWRLGKSENIRDMTSCIIPYLINKKREAEIIFEYTSWMKGHSRGRFLYSIEEAQARFALISELEQIRAA